MKMLTTSHKPIILLLAALLLAVTVAPVSDAQTYSHIYVDAAKGVNAATSRGTAAAPYKSITFALLISGKNNLPDPWHVHIRPGTYTADPAKPATEREVFPIRLRSGMIFEGTTDADECIIDAQHLGETSIPILLGENVEGVHIRNVTIKNMRMQTTTRFTLGIFGLPALKMNAQIILLGAKQSTNTAGQKPNILKGCIVHQDEDARTLADKGFGSSQGLWTNTPLELVENTFSNNAGVADISNYDNQAARIVVTNNTFRNTERGVLKFNGSFTGDITGNFFGHSPNGSHIGLYDIGFLDFKRPGLLEGNIRDNTFSGSRGVRIGSINRHRAPGTIKMNGDITNNIFQGNWGVYKQPGGALFVDGLNGNITHNTFTNNTSGDRLAPMPGGAVHVETLNGHLTHNTFTNNASNVYGGAVHVKTFKGNVTHNTFTNNTARGGGGGFHAYDMTGDIANNEFTGNTGGAVQVLSKLTGNITHNIFDSNIAQSANAASGGIVLHGRMDSPVEISNNIFFNNKINLNEHSINTVDGGTLFLQHTAHVINNVFMMTADEPVDGKYKPHIWVTGFGNEPVPVCRFHNNIFVGMFVAIHTDGPELPITHNIFYNIGQDIVSQGGAGFGNDLDFWELLSENASNNLAVAPLFVLGEKDFHLQAGSPAIDAGTNAYAPDDDLDGATRPAGAAVDIGPYEYGATKRPNTVADVPEPDTPATTADVPETTDARVHISPASVASSAVGQQMEFSLNITRGEGVAGYQATLQFDTTALRYVSSTNGDYLPAGALFVDPVVEGNLIKLNAVSLAGESNGDGALAQWTFEVIAAKASTLTLSDVLLTNSDGKAFLPTVENAEITEPTRLKADVNGDGIVNIQDLALVAGQLGQTGTNRADVNGDGVVNIQDLAIVAGALGTTAAAPALYPKALETLTAAEVKQWLSAAQQLDLTDTTSQRGILFLQQLLAALTPEETALLPNFPNPFNPETWIPYQLAKPADVTVRIYAMDGKLVRTLTLGHQAVGKYHHRSHAAYWDGKNEVGESVASGVYFYTLSTESTRDSVTAGDFIATRKMLIRK